MAAVMRRRDSANRICESSEACGGGHPSNPLLSSASSSSSSTKQAVCEECKANPSKYKCPGCSFRSCSLACVKSHKKRTSCTGKRDQTQFVPLSQFDDNLLLSDFNLLEDVKRVAESARRTRFKLGAYPNFRLPGHLKGLQNAAAKRSTKLWFLPSGMLRRKRNESRYNRRNKSIYWTIEWRFHSTDAILLEHGVKESITFGSIIQKHLQPSPWNHKLRKFCDEQLENLRFFISKFPKGPRSAFRELDMNAPLSHLLSNLMVLEYPVIHVFLPSDSYDFEVVRDLKPIPVKTEPKPCETHNNNLPEQLDGNHFREEEFEEEGILFPEPQILDLVNDLKPQEQQTAKNDNAFELPEEEFEFDEDPLPKFLLEDYNPDDYFDFEMADALASDELEEGEIPGSE